MGSTALLPNYSVCVEDAEHHLRTIGYPKDEPVVLFFWGDKGGTHLPNKKEGDTGPWNWEHKREWCTRAHGNASYWPQVDGLLKGNRWSTGFRG